MSLLISGGSNGSLNNLSLSGNTATIVDTARAGGIVQVVQATTTSSVTNTTSTYADSNLSASITPSSSTNKILIMTHQSYRWSRSSGVDNGIGIRLLRDSTTIWNPVIGAGPYYNYTDNSAEFNDYAKIVYLDSPATTSSVTYKTQGRRYSSGGSGQIIFQVSSALSNIVLMEVVA